jgi:hypothetical protein
MIRKLLSDASADASANWWGRQPNKPSAEYIASGHAALAARDADAARIADDGTSRFDIDPTAAERCVAAGLFTTRECAAVQKRLDLQRKRGARARQGNCLTDLFAALPAQAEFGADTTAASLVPNADAAAASADATISAESFARHLLAQGIDEPLTAAPQVQAPVLMTPAFQRHLLAQGFIGLRHGRTLIVPIP